LQLIAKNDIYFKMILTQKVVADGNDKLQKINDYETKN
jgi:disulfide oxidoreductase YuzD